jgi:hypothetical protein
VQNIEKRLELEALLMGKLSIGGTIRFSAMGSLWDQMYDPTDIFYLEQNFRRNFYLSVAVDIIEQLDQQNRGA